MKLNILLAVSAFSLFAAAAEASLPNGGVWKDTDGVMINAHGGALMRCGDVWYWYGEHKTAGKGGNKAWVGVSCYSSKNLLDWKNEGIAFKVATPEEVKANPALAGVEAGCVLERPKVIRSQDGSRYVMYFHLELKGRGYGAAHVGIAQSQSPTGPFVHVWNGRPHAGIPPVNGGEDDPETMTTPWGSKGALMWKRHLAGGQMSRDMTLFADPADGRVYHVFASEDNSCLHLGELRPDGLGYTGKWARLTPGDWTEAPALVKHGDWYYLLGSGCTGWRPNAARYYRAKSVWGPWERMGNPCRGGKNPEITWGGQSTGIFTVNGVSFAMFDQWRPSNAIDGRYVWLPISFSSAGTMAIDWRDGFSPRLAEPWQDEYVNEINRLPSRSPIRPADEKMSVKLDGEWDFTFVNGDFRDQAKLAVPGCWQLQGARMGKEWDPPLYTADRYPFAYDPPRVMTEPKDRNWTSWKFRNPRGIYRRRVELPEIWRGRRVTLRLYGYSSAVYVRANGVEIGYGEDGRLPNEFDLTPVAFAKSGNAGGATLDLELEVLKHCDGTYLEDQDFWRMSGLFRSVELLAESPGGLFDFNVETRVSGDSGVVRVVARDAKSDYFWKIFDNRGDELARGVGAETVRLPGISAWSPSKPALYRVRVECGGDAYDKQVGFRTVTIEDGVLKLNGERVVIHGVNRHEHSPKGGYAMTRAEMENDMQLLRRFNVNAVRTSHYPNDPYWYELCDRHGIMLVAEANVECHGSGHPNGKRTLSHLPSWRKAMVERNLNHVAVFRDHPSIIVWSLGNESGNGGNLVAAYEAVKAADPTRPVQYEGAFVPYARMPLEAHGSDVICPMYERPHRIAAALEKGVKRPYILCEFAHSMGNSTGNFDEYMDLIAKYPRAQGGFIWDFADQGLEFDGKLRYGGDFGDIPNNRQYVCNGIFDSYRNPHPAACEVGYWYGGKRPVSLDSGKKDGKPADADKAEISLDEIVRSIKLSCWRAPTDNDRGNRLPGRARPWRIATETGVLPDGVSTNLTVVRRGNAVDVDFALTVPAGAPELPRAGLVMRIPGDGNTRVAWRGAGPHENYSDRRASAAIGDYAMSVDELNASGYIKPQECGHRTETARLSVGGVAIEGKFEWNVHPWSVFDLEQAAHVEDLPIGDGSLYVHLDAAMCGVGGDDSWGAPVHDQYRLQGERVYRLRFSLTVPQ